MKSVYSAVRTGSLNKAYGLRDAPPTNLTFNNCTLCPHCIYVFCIYMRTNSDLCHSTVHIYTQTIHRTTQNKQYIQHKDLEECEPCCVFAGFTLAFAVQLRKEHGKTSVRVAIHKNTIRMHSHNN